ncbi:hypothetical protein SAY87_030926 [Trapa incisa]|uniref:DDE Tnp4 domain-containing protein n=1 Tax=Trapa incisa TaxID=236973 RepID=A0AAN7KQ93_9MYRT|nr:hypothetical protein SAY87_030926 [Trapa incisa]
MKLSTLSDEQYLSSIYDFLQQMNEPAAARIPMGKQRRRDSLSDEEEENEDDDGKKRKDLKGIITSLSLLEDQEREDSRERETATVEERRLVETNHRKKTRAMVDFYSNLGDYYAEVEELDQSRRKKSRALAGAIATTGLAAEMVDAKKSDKGGKKSSGEGGQSRRLWVKDRSNSWWDECSRRDYPEEEFRKAFRMGRDTFDMICEELNSVIAKEDTTLRSAIPVRQRVAVCIWRLATGEPLRLVSKKFGLGISTCHKLVLEVCSAIKTVLMPKFLLWPDEDSLRKIKEEFELVSSIPGVVGSMYTTHIPIIAPKISVAAYFNKRHTERNQKTSYSITLQGVVDSRGVFTDVCIGWPGSMPDDQVLEKSALYQRAQGGLLKGVWIVGGSGYPLLDWVLVPYTQQKLTWTQHTFNEKIGDVQRVAKEAFAKLKGRWSCLQKRTEVKLQDLPVVLGACCVLHNICEMRGEEMDHELRIEIMDDEMIPVVALRSASSMKARDSIAHNILHHGLAGSSFP